MTMRITPLQQKIFPELEKGRTDFDEIAAGLGCDRSSVYRARDAFERYQVERAREEAERNKISVLRLGWTDLWRWPEELRTDVLATFRRLDELMAEREPDATAPPDYDEGAVLSAFTTSAPSNPALDNASDVFIAGIAVNDGEAPGVA